MRAGYENSFPFVKVSASAPLMHCPQARTSSSLGPLPSLVALLEKLWERNYELSGKNTNGVVYLGWEALILPEFSKVWRNFAPHLLSDPNDRR
jgi:hypothetical protein